MVELNKVSFSETKTTGFSSRIANKTKSKSSKAKLLKQSTAPNLPSNKNASSLEGL